MTFFKDTLNSLVNQTNQNFTVYIGDDASPEDPRELITTFEGKLNFFYKRFPENLGSISLVSQWERCISMTQGEKWILLLGDDDILGPDVIEAWYKNLPKFRDNSFVIRFASQNIDENGHVSSQPYFHPEIESTGNSVFRRLRGFTRSSLSEYVFSTEKYHKFKFHNYPLAWHSDDRAWVEFSGNKPIFTINDAIVQVRTSPISISGKGDNLEVKYKVTEMFLKYLIRKKIGIFEKDKRFFILETYENHILKKRSLNTLEWILLFYLYNMQFNRSHLKQFLLRSLKR